jgi:2-polyprenyl-6-methoxyphenol hydroxylase-like FAD-dependent oxidoreductase
MPRIVVVGGGVVGLSTALMLAREGLEVIVLERDGDAKPGSPDDAWQAWDRRGVAQFRQPHYFHAAGSHILDSRLPEVKEALLRAHGTSFDMLALMPPFIEDRAPREGDGRFVTVTARRPVIEYAVADIAERHLDVRRGVAVTELLTGPPAAGGVPHVTGVRTSEGEQLAADLVIDAMGRRSTLPGWLAGLGARPPAEEAEDSGFTYYTRYFRSATGPSPPFLVGLLTPFDSYSLLTLPGDAGTWSVTVYISSRDQALKDLRHHEKWTALVAACPLHAQLLDGEPLTEVLAMSGVVDRQRRCVVDGTPVVTGLVTVGDSSCCTNPSLGRGMTMGLMHAAGTVEVVRDHLDDPLALAHGHDQMTQARITPWYRNTVGFDRARKEQIDAAIEGRPARAPAGGTASVQSAFLVAMQRDADLFRAFLETVAMLALPEEVLARPGLQNRIMAAADGHVAVAVPGPARDDLLRMLA